MIPNERHVVGERVDVTSQVETPVLVVAVVVAKFVCKMINNFFSNRKLQF